MLKNIFKYKNNSDGYTRTIKIFGKEFTYAKGFWINYLLIKKLWWIFPTKETRNEFKKVCEEADYSQKAYKLSQILPSIQAKKITELSKKTRIKVLFLLNENSKWKAQTLYDLMAKSEKFEPVMGLTLLEHQRRLNKNEREKIFKNNFDFFTDRNIKVIPVYNPTLNKAYKLQKFSTDIIFYPQPWSLPPEQLPEKTYKDALLCYVPYHSPTYGDRHFDSDLLFFKYLFKYYVANNDYKETFFEWSGLKNLVATGHPMLDQFKQNEKRNNEAKKGYVIYAPHHSLVHELNAFNNQNCGTFLKNGEFILEYAKKHPEIKWAFKPHPTLKLRLKRIGWSNEKIKEYYGEWEKIAKCCYDASYIDLFFDSKAMITDCISFLTEYFCTEKPLLHLISKEMVFTPVKSFEKILTTFYDINNNDEFLQTMDEVVIKNNDYKKEERIKVLKESKLSEGNAAQNIIDDLEKSIWG